MLLANELVRGFMKFFTRQLSSPVGPLTLMANHDALISIEFKATKKNDESPVLDIACKELALYFAGELTQFKTPLQINGTQFQKKCWDALQEIPYGETISYKEEAIKLGGSNYARAVAGANNKNVLPIIIPCHRVIGHDGSLVGYAGGLKIKENLLELESGNR